MNESGARRLARVRHGAVTIPGATAPHDSAHYRIFHPALFTGADAERQTGALPPDVSDAPWPIVIVLGGINVNPDGYRWLATGLASAGVATVVFQFVGEITPGDVGITPGLDLTALTPSAWGTRPSATVVGPLLDALADEQRSGPLAGLLDLDRVALAGHSAGGTIALLNAEPAWFGVRGVISYAGHTMPATMIGHPPGTVLPIAAGVPALVMGGGNDAVIAASVVRYGPSADGAPHDPVGATFDTAASSPGSALAILRSGTHLTLCDPVDPTTARGFLEAPDPDGPAHRRLVASLVESFLDAVFDMGRGTAKPAEVGADPMLSEFRQW